MEHFDNRKMYRWTYNSYQHREEKAEYLNYIEKQDVKSLSKFMENLSGKEQQRIQTFNYSINEIEI